jgi:hypothetical protein
MLRQVIFPAQNTILLHLPDELVGKKVEVIAFSFDDVTSQGIRSEKQHEKTFDEAILFFKENAVDFTQIKKWTREDLYE